MSVQEMDNEASMVQRSTADIEEKVSSEMINMLHRNLFLSMPVNIILASIVFISFYFIAQDVAVFDWYLANVVVSLLRLGLPYFYLPYSKSNSSKQTFFMVGVVISSMLWGVLDSVLLLPNDIQQQMIVIIIIAGILSGGVQTLQPSLLASIVSITFMGVPLCIWLLLQTGITYTILGLSMTCYVLSMILISFWSYNALKQSLLLRYENLDLVNNLSQANSNLNQSNLMLVASENILQNIMDNAPIGMLQIALDGRIEQINLAVFDIMGYKKTELSKLSIVDLIDPEDQANDIEAKKNLLEGQLTSSHQEQRYIHKNGHLVWVDAHLSLLTDSTGKPLSFILLIQNINERKKNEAIVHELNEKTAATLALLQQRDTEMGYINKMNELLHVCQDLDEAQSVINLALNNLFPTLSGGFILYDKVSLNMNTVLQWGNHPLLKKSFSTDDCWALRSGGMNIVKDADTDLVCYHFESQPPGGCVCLPLIANTGIIGMIFLNSPDNNIIQDNQLQLAITFSEIIKLFLANIQLRESLQK